MSLSKRRWTALGEWTCRAASVALVAQCLASAGTFLEPPGPLDAGVDEGRADSEGRRLATVLADARARQSAPADLAARVAQLGPRAIPAVLDVCEVGTFEEAIGEYGRVFHPVGPPQREGLYLALSTFEWNVVERELRRRLGEAASVERRVAVLEAIGGIAPPSGIGLFTRSLETGNVLDRRALCEPFEDALAAALARDRASYRRLPALLEAVHPSFVASVVAATRRGDDRRALAGLGGLLSVVHEADSLILIEIADLAKTVARPVPAHALVPIRRALMSTEAATRIEAVKALGRLDDVASISDLIDLLGSGDRTLVREARFALERLTAERFGADQDAWERWHLSAQEWLRSDYPELLAALKGPDASATSRALLRVARYRVFRHQLVQPVAEVLESADENTARIACAVLGHFATPSAIPPLVRSLDHGSVVVRKSALEALVRATGVNHGEKSADWRLAHD